MEDVGDAERKPVMSFEGRSKTMVLNKVNSRTIAALYGDDTLMWQGKPLVLFPAQVDFRGDTVEAIRVRAPKPPATPKPPVREQLSENPGDDMNDEIPF